MVAKSALPDSLEKLSAPDRALLNSCVNRDISAMKTALREGANPRAVFYDPVAIAISISGKEPLHVAATHGFSEGVRLLAELGVEIDAPDHNPRTRNTPLNVATSHRQEFALLLALGAEADAPNRLGYDSRQIATSADKTLPGKPSFHQILRLFDAVPSRNDYSGLTLEALFARDERGLCLMDNPKTLRYIDELADALEQSGTPLTLAHLQRIVPKEASYLVPDRMPEVLDKLKIGVENERVAKTLPAGREVTYLERIAQAGKLETLVEALNKQGERFQEDELLQKSEPSPLMALAQKHHQLQAFFTQDNWKDGHSSQLSRVYQQVPADERWQINNFRQLTQSLRAETPRATGIGR